MPEQGLTIHRVYDDLTQGMYWQSSRHYVVNPSGHLCYFGPGSGRLLSPKEAACVGVEALRGIGRVEASIVSGNWASTRAFRSSSIESRRVVA